MSSDNPTIAITSARLGLFLSLVAAATFGWSVLTYFKNGEIKDLEQDVRIAQVEKFGDSIVKLTDKTDELKDTMIRLTAVIEQNIQQKRASYEDRPTPGLTWENIASQDK